MKVGLASPASNARLHIFCPGVRYDEVVSAGGISAVFDGGFVDPTCNRSALCPFLLVLDSPPFEKKTRTRQTSSQDARSFTGWPCPWFTVAHDQLMLFLYACSREPNTFPFSKSEKEHQLESSRKGISRGSTTPEPRLSAPCRIVA